MSTARRYRPTTDTGRDIAVRAVSVASRADLQIDRQAGWACPSGAVKYHYFLRGVALCHGFMWMGRVDNSNHDCADRCKVCRDKREDLAARGEVPR